MTIREMTVTLEGASPILYNRETFMWEKDKWPKNKGESYEEYEARVWPEKAIVNDKLECLIPGIWVKKAIIGSQTRGKYEIPPKGKSKGNMKSSFVAGLSISDSVVTNDSGTPILKTDLISFSKGVVVQHSKILRIRPMLVCPWQCAVTIQLLDGAISEQNVIDCLTWAGFYSGLGDWRIEKGGDFGRFGLK
jgi:hypothetical protein